MKADAESLMPIAEEATRLLKALSHPARLMICCQLNDGEMSVGELEETLGIRQPRLSRELAKLREDGLVETRRESKSVFYRLAPGARVAEMVEAICAVMMDEKGQKCGSQGEPQAKRPIGAGAFGIVDHTTRS